MIRGMFSLDAPPESIRLARRLGMVGLVLVIFAPIGVDVWTGEESTMRALSRAIGSAVGLALGALVVYGVRRLFGARRRGEETREKLE
ncbi:hypothetical protein [Albimonas pacifica]|uniref:Uncharacterized protein n=1 Tax=Albimonas pacifica TaxID=1114924 RepID=A0A1I3PBP2_9RHOB|nr:hypothetical protein [Albimonas pacifica]SFJ18831.1 hypothetical protein SAMN05216258_11627 [Albimonas pacifica]